MPIRAIRGAITAENTPESILDATTQMLKMIMERNRLQICDVASLVFTATRDLTAAYPAVAARKMGFTEAGLMCMQEQYVEGSLAKCVRVLVLAEGGGRARHVYLGGASVLRPDLAGEPFQIAIDGPSGSGKSTVAKRLAARLGFIYFDTGAMYRAVALFCMENGVNMADGDAVCTAANALELEIRHVDGVQKVFMNGEDVSLKIRSAECGAGASAVGVFDGVRTRLVALQRQLANGISVVMDGRDIGTNVLPNADLKIFLDASVDVRVKRRCGELEALRMAFDEDDLRREIIARDENDRNRKISPLVMAGDAVLIDASALSPDEVEEAILSEARKRGLER